MGFLGLGSTLTLLRMKYGSPESLEFTERVAREMAEVGWKVGIDLASEKGPAPIMTDEFTVTEAMLVRRPEMRRDGYKVGDKVLGRVLLARYSRYMQQFDTQLTERIAQEGCRFTHHSSIAPTGTISLVTGQQRQQAALSRRSRTNTRVMSSARAANQGKGGRALLRAGLAYRILVNPEAGPDAVDPETGCRTTFYSADDIKPRQHVDAQGRPRNGSIPRFPRPPTSPRISPYEDFKDIYLYAYEKGLKGLHHLPLQPGGVPGRVGEGQGLEAPPTASSSKAARWSRLGATKRSSTTARCTPPPISTMP